MPTEEATSGPRPTFYRRNASLARLVQYAYRLHDFELIGGPEWVRKDLFEITAKPPANDAQSRLMLQSLLEERFKLVLRQQEREGRFYALVVARRDGRTGPELRRCEDPSNPPQMPNKRPPMGSIPLAGVCGSLAPVIEVAGNVMRAPVVDRTGLTGRWSYVLFYPPGPDWPGLAEMPPFDVALRDELGLNLQAHRGPVKVMVIQSVQPPTEN
jgi:uncharacterized protein (TIGR03435 family)